MRTNLVVVSTPNLHLPTGVVKRQEPVGVQTFRPELASEKLDVALGDQIAVVLILGKADCRPLGLGGNYLPTCRIPGLADRLRNLEQDRKTHFSFFDILKDLGHFDLRRKTMRIHARPASEQEIIRLNLASGEFVAETESLIADSNDRPNFYSKMAYASSRVEFFVDPKYFSES